MNGLVKANNISFSLIIKLEYFSKNDIGKKSCVSIKLCTQTFVIFTTFVQDFLLKLSLSKLFHQKILTISPNLHQIQFSGISKGISSFVISFNFSCFLSFFSFTSSSFSF
jgi:hypothetical protein